MADRSEPRLFAIEENSRVGEVRRWAAGLAETVGFDQTTCGNIAIVATEMATNMLRHARSGELLLQFMCRTQAASAANGAQEPDVPVGVELLSLDKGPGMDLTRSLRDGYSTAGGPGTGLGAIARLSHKFEAYTRPGGGTALLSRFFLEPPEESTGRIQFGIVSIPKTGEIANGDGHFVAHLDGRSMAMVADGLGHGPLAAEGAAEARFAFRKELRAPFDFDAFYRRAHECLMKTRGAAMAAVEIDPSAASVRYSGVGNISASLWSEYGVIERRLVSQNGTVGLEMRHLREFQYRWPRRGMLVMFSDGLRSTWDLRDYPGLIARDPLLIAGVLYRDLSRGRDDTTVLVGKEP